MIDDAKLAQTLATAVLGIDTVWGGDVMCPSGTGRFIADSWFSDEPLPPAYHHPAAARLRASGGVGAEPPDVEALDAYLRDVDLPAAIAEVVAQGRAIGGLRGAFLTGQGECLQVMWELAEELRGRGPRVPYERCVLASTGEAPEPPRPGPRRERVARRLAAAGYATGTPEQLLEAVAAWRRERLVPRKAIPQLGAAFIAQLEEGTRRHVVPHLPAALREIPRANVRFLSIENAFFSGSMNYVGRARRPDGSPEYEATYEINSTLEISVPEFAQLVAHEVVPGHVTTFALAQALYVRREVGFEASVIAMNTRGSTLSEGIANNAMLMAFGVNEVDELDDDDLMLGMLLGQLQDDAKSLASWLLWEERRPREEVAARLRRECLVTEERADKFSGAWGQHPLLGRMYLPSYRSGTERVAELRRRHPPEVIVPALFCARGLVDIVTIDQVLK
jgi:hypothetical protein